MADTTSPRTYLDSFPWIRQAVADAECPASWDSRDEPDVLARIEDLCLLLNPFLPGPEYVAIAARELAGQESRDVFSVDHRPADELLEDLALLIQYLAMVGAALEVVTGNDGAAQAT